MPHLRVFVSCLTRLLVAVAVVAGLRAQCNPQWLPGDPIVSPRGTVEAMTSWDPDGAGPAAVALVAGGWFAVANETAVQVATYDGSQWQRLGGPLPGTCYAFTSYNSQLIAVCRNTVHAWNGTAWQTIGTSVGSRLAAATVFQGDLVVAGGMTSINGAPVANIARWNGTSWFALGTGLTGFVNALASHTFANGPGLYAGGNFLTAGGLNSPNLAVWTGSAWAAPATPNGPVMSLAVRSTVMGLTSYLFVGGGFTQIGSLAAGQVARLNGLGTWSAMSLAAAPTDFGSVRLLVRGVGQTGYECTAAVDGSVQRWTGAGWNLLGGTTVHAGATQLAIHYHGGRYHAAGRNSTPHVASFDGTAWQRVAGLGIDGLVNAVLADGDDAVIAGDFVTISGVTMNGIARGDSNAWLPIGGGVTGGTGQVHAIVRLPDGRLVAGGDFTVLNGAVANRLAVWDGTSWSPLGGGTNGTVWALLVLPGGDLLVGGEFTLAGTTPAARIARWNGVAWAVLGSGIGQGAVRTLASSGANILAGGLFTISGQLPAFNIAWFSNGIWSRIGSGTNGPVLGSLSTSTGEMLVVGDFSTAAGQTVRALGRVNSTSVSEHPNLQTAPLGGIEVGGVLELPNRGLLVGGRNFTVPLGASSQSDRLQRFDPQTNAWSPLVVEVGAGRMALALAPNGDVLCTNTVTVGGLVSSGFARLQATCPATATSYGTACPGAGGPITLRATSLPWLRSSYRAETTGLAANMLGIAATGLAAAAVPLPLVLPGSGACDLLVDPLQLQVLVPTNGVTTHAVAMPTSIALVGAQLFDQVVGVAFAANGAISGLHGSNGLQLGLGACY